MENLLQQLNALPRPIQASVPSFPPNGNTDEQVQKNLNILPALAELSRASVAFRNMLEKKSEVALYDSQDYVSECAYDKR